MDCKCHIVRLIQGNFPVVDEVHGDRRRIDPACEAGTALRLHVIFSRLGGSVLGVVIHLAHVLDAAGAL